MTQFDKIREKLKRQTYLILKKLKISRNSRELSNCEIEIMLYQVGSREIANDSESAERLEELHNRLAKLSTDEMQIVRYKFFEGFSNKEIAKNQGRESEGWTRKKLSVIYKKLSAHYQI